MPIFEGFKNLNEDELVDCFCEIFYHELESWFSADIACCDSCYDEFISKWPAVYTRYYDFQKSCIDINCFYSNTRLKDYFYEDEFSNLISNIYCPNCGNPIYAYMWPYNLNFSIPKNFESILHEMDRISKKTPFLLLTHPFAKKTLKTIKFLGKNVKAENVESKYFRARKFEIGKIYNCEDFKYPPRDIVKEGRYNHAGTPVLYLGDSETTCFYELRKPVEGIATAELLITRPIKILDLIKIEDDWNNPLNVAAWSSLMSSPNEGDGWYNPQYTFTRFISDCAIASGFDAIKYPSVRLGERHNIVLLDGCKAWEYINVKNIKERKVIDIMRAGYD